MELVRNEVIPYQWEALNDRIEGAAPSFCMRNFSLAAKIIQKRQTEGSSYQEITYPTNLIETLPTDMNSMEDRFYGFLFQDSDFYKWIEAVAYSLTQHPDPDLEKIADQAIDLVCSAQQPNGYLDTFYIINNPTEDFTNLRSNHELYCFGHLAEGAIAYYKATGKKALLKATERFADYIESCMGMEEGKKRGYPGHEIAEMALAALYEITGNEKYLKLGKFFIDERGQKPYYFDMESTEKTTNMDALRYHYHQAHLPVRQQTEAVGHAVRAVYLYSGMADFARLTNDQSLKDACDILWQDITQKKMYITGGIGGTHFGEAFSYAYDLPNDTAYAETCASIGLVFFARRMLELDVDSRYSDIIERALYNGILSGMAEDGKSFFYTNPLSVLPEACHKDDRVAHIKPVRQKWFGCACCPPNLARFLSSLSTYAFTEHDDTLFIHLYMGAIIEKERSEGMIHVAVKSSFPQNGDVIITISTKKAQAFTIALRIPEWANDHTLHVDDADIEYKKGYLYLTKIWKDKETIQITFPMNITRIKSNPLVRENIGKTALMRGPIVYCLEEADNGENLHLISLPQKGPVHTTAIAPNDKLSIPNLVVSGSKLKLLETDTPLYSTASSDTCYETCELTFVPYFTWANRGEGEMQVWVRES